MSPSALALIDAVFQLAFHHDRRARTANPGGRADSPRRFLTRVVGPLPSEPGHIRIDIVCVAATETTLSVIMDVENQRLLASQVALAELNLNRSGMARVIGELEAWCYRQLPQSS